MNAKNLLLSLLIVFSIYFWMKKPDEIEETNFEPKFQESHKVSSAVNSFPLLPDANVVKIQHSEKPALNAREAAKKWEKIQRLVQCSQIETCAPSSNEVKEKHFFLKEKILEEVNWFLQFQADSAEAKKRSYEAAILILQYPEEDIQFAALSWIQQLPISPKTMDIIESEMKDVVDPNLVVLLLKEVKRYQGSSLEPRSMQFLKSIFLEGSIFASRELARSIGILLTKENFLEVNDWLREVSPESAKYRLLSNSLAEYRRHSAM
jgi:hypothetical protein